VCNGTVLTVIRERQSECYAECVTAQHIYYTDTVQTVQSATKLYLQ